MLDYRLSNGKISFSNFGNSGITEVTNRSESFNIGGNSHFYSMGYSKSNLNMITNTLSVENQFSKVHMNFKFSHSYSESEISDILFNLGEERKARRIAKIIVDNRPIKHADELSDLIRCCAGILNCVSLNDSQ